MNRKKLVTSIILSLALVAFLGSACLAQTAGQITVKGKIAYLDAEGGYYVQGISPSNVYIITNQNQEVLAKLVKAGKPVTIQAQVIGGDSLVITAINGKPYSGNVEPVFK